MADNVDSKFCDERNNNINKRIDSVENRIEKLEDKIEVVKASFNNKLDVVNDAFHGDNDRVGILEQLRNIKKNIGDLGKEISKKITELYKKGKWAFVVIVFLMIFLIGGRVMGLKIEDFKKWFSKNTEVKQVEKNVGKPVKKIEYIISK